MFSPARLLELKNENACAALCTVVETSGSTPRKAGAAMVVHWDKNEVGRIEGTVGGGAFEHEIRRHAMQSLREKKASFVEIALTTDLGMCCGGSMQVFIEPLEMRPSAFIFGAGHIGKQVANLAQNLGFKVNLLDSRVELLADSSIHFDVKKYDDYDAEDIRSLELTEDSFVLVVTHDHQKDQELIEELLRYPHRTLGMIGSMRKAKLCAQKCMAKGFSEEELSHFVSPVGLHIHAETPEEIALSIVAQWVQLRRETS